MVWHSYTLVTGLFGVEDDVATGLVNLSVAPLRDQRGSEAAATDLAGFSCDRQDLIADQVQADLHRLWTVEVVG